MTTWSIMPCACREQRSSSNRHLRPRAVTRRGCHGHQELTRGGIIYGRPAGATARWRHAPPRPPSGWTGPTRGTWRGAPSGAGCACHRRRGAPGGSKGAKRNASTRKGAASTARAAPDIQAGAWEGLGRVAARPMVVWPYPPDVPHFCLVCRSPCGPPAPVPMAPIPHLW